MFLILTYPFQNTAVAASAVTGQLQVALTTTTTTTTTITTTATITATTTTAIITPTTSDPIRYYPCNC